MMNSSDLSSFVMIVYLRDMNCFLCVLFGLVVRPSDRGHTLSFPFVKPLSAYQQAGLVPPFCCFVVEASSVRPLSAITSRYVEHRALSCVQNDHFLRD